MTPSYVVAMGMSGTPLLGLGGLLLLGIKVGLIIALGILVLLVVLWFDQKRSDRERSSYSAFHSYWTDSTGAWCRRFIMQACERTLISHGNQYQRSTL